MKFCRLRRSREGGSGRKEWIGREGSAAACLLYDLCETELPATGESRPGAELGEGGKKWALEVGGGFFHNFSE